MDTNTSHRPEVAIAILHQDGKFLMQLRDDLPNILYPGHWALFGGHLEPDESSDAAIRRELLEEIGYTPPTLVPFGCYEDARVIRHVYQGTLTVGLDALVLNEGADMDLVTLEEIMRGDRYSRRTQQIRPLGPPHQRILLDFVNQQI
ncbi:NUDIX hydrolase [Leptothermofonsia sp. ETS-13]|uniref:NUDIX hydrolase n=1 Tax=Leptothermofonsia sp. ETS-13 TaxID=3035696 RepID=UPI003BA03309